MTLSKKLNSNVEWCNMLKQPNETSSSAVTQPHDKLVKRLLSNPETAKDILSLYLPPEVSQLVNLNNLSLQRDSFIDDEHRVFAVDLLYKTTFDGEEGYLWILLEHQRKSDPWLPVRIFKYMATIWDHIRKTSKSHKIPLIYPIIIYNGDRPYSHTLTFKDMIEPKASQDLFESFFKTPFCLIDLTVIEDEILRKQLQNHVRGVALLMTLKHVLDKNLQIIFEQLLVHVYKQLDQGKSRDDVADLLYYLLNEGKSLHEDQFWFMLHNEFSKEVEEKVMTIAQRLMARGLKQGIEQGMQQGMQQGVQQGIQQGMQQGIQQGVQQGMQQGIEKEKIIIAERMLSEGCELSFITKLTQLSLEKLMVLKKGLH
jgi:predicted transposase/invertase (TIGR01784 family)